jgi:hypothetical protein
MLSFSRFEARDGRLAVALERCWREMVTVKDCSFLVGCTA